MTGNVESLDFKSTGLGFAEVRCWVVCVDDVWRGNNSLDLVSDSMYSQIKLGIILLVVLFILCSFSDWCKERERFSSVVFLSAPLIIHVPRQRATMLKRGGYLSASWVCSRVGGRWRRFWLITYASNSIWCRLVHNLRSHGLYAKDCFGYEKIPE